MSNFDNFDIFITKKTYIVGSFDDAENCLKTLFLDTQYLSLVCHRFPSRVANRPISVQF